MSKAKQSEKLKGNKNAKKGDHGSVIVRIPVSLVDDLYKCLELEGEYTPDTSRVAEYALDIVSGHIRTKIEHSEAYII